MIIIYLSICLIMAVVSLIIDSRNKLNITDLDNNTQDNNISKKIAQINKDIEYYCSLLDQLCILQRMYENDLRVENNLNREKKLRSKIITLDKQIYSIKKKIEKLESEKDVI